MVSQNQKLWCNEKYTTFIWKVCWAAEGDEGWEERIISHKADSWLSIPTYIRANSFIIFPGPMRKRLELSVPKSATLKWKYSIGFNFRISLSPKGKVWCQNLVFSTWHAWESFQTLIPQQRVEGKCQAEVTLYLKFICVLCLRSCQSVSVLGSCSLFTEKLDSRRGPGKDPVTSSGDYFRIQFRITSEFNYFRIQNSRDYFRKSKSPHERPKSERLTMSRVTSALVRFHQSM